MAEDNFLVKEMLPEHPRKKKKSAHAAQDLEVSRFWAQVPQEHWKVSRWAQGGSVALALRINDIHDYSNGTERREEQIKGKETNQYFICLKESDHLDHSFFSFKALWRNQNWGKKKKTLYSLHFPKFPPCSHS